MYERDIILIIYVYNVPIEKAVVVARDTILIIYVHTVPIEKAFVVTAFGLGRLFKY